MCIPIISKMACSPTGQTLTQPNSDQPESGFATAPLHESEKHFCFWPCGLFLLFLFLDSGAASEAPVLQVLFSFSSSSSSSLLSRLFSFQSSSQSHSSQSQSYHGALSQFQGPFHPQSLSSQDIPLTQGMLGTTRWVALSPFTKG